MLRVGLTGGVGSGKSMVADMLAGLGARVSRSDDVGRELMQPGQPVMRAIAEHFGPKVLKDNGELDRSMLARLAFVDGHLEDLNAIVHPAVIERQAQWFGSVALDQPEAVAVVESALIFETRHGGSGAHNMQDSAPWRTRFDCIVLVTAPEKLRRERYINRATGFDPGVTADAAAADFAARSRAQWSDERKAALADTVLENDGSVESLRAKVQALYSDLKQMALGRTAQSYMSESGV